MSDKIAEIKEWLAETFASFNDSTRIDEFHGYFAPEYTNFWLGHSLLVEGWMSKEELQTLYNAGMQPDMRLRHPNVQLYDGFAVCTMYADGTMTDATGNIHVGPWRLTSVIVPHGDSWQSVHNQLMDCFAL